MSCKKCTCTHNDTVTDAIAHFQSQKFLLDDAFVVTNEQLKAHPQWMPARQTELADAFDLCFLSNSNNGYVIIEPHQQILKGLGIALNLPAELSAELRPRSSLGSRMGLMLTNADMLLTNRRGLIDGDYTDELKANLWNFTNKPVTLRDGDRIVQIRFMQSMIGLCAESNGKYQLRPVTTQRAGGFGSTG